MRRTGNVQTANELSINWSVDWTSVWYDASNFKFI